MTLYLFVALVAFTTGYLLRERALARVIAEREKMKARAERAEALVAAVDESDSSLVNALEAEPRHFFHCIDLNYPEYRAYRYATKSEPRRGEKHEFFTVKMDTGELAASTLREAWQKAVRFKNAMAAAEAKDGAES